jgi:Na+-transporting NADH:ubiquinone oxidoreductase subunit NqrD
MKDLVRYPVSQESMSPISVFAGGSLLILASSRTAYSLVSAGALLWVYGFTQGIFFSCKQFLPDRGREIVLLFLSSFISSLFILLLWFINPLTALEQYFFVILAASSYLGSGLPERCADLPPLRALVTSLKQALSLGLFIIAFSLLREPLGSGTLSLPGGLQGVIIAGRFLPMRIIAVSSGAFLLLGYILALYRIIRYKKTQWEDLS